MTQKFTVYQQAGVLNVAAQHDWSDASPRVVIAQFPASQHEAAQHLCQELNGVAAAVAIDGDPFPTPASCTFLVWEGGGENKTGGTFLQAGFAEYEQAKRFCLEGVKLWAEGKHHLAHYGTTEDGRMEYFDVYSVPTTPHGHPSPIRRFAIQKLVHGVKSC